MRVTQARDAEYEDTRYDLADRIDLNNAKRRLLLLRVQDIAQQGA